MREDKSGDSENGKDDDDELSCMVEGKREGDCIRRSSRSSMGVC